MRTHLLLWPHALNEPNKTQRERSVTGSHPQRTGCGSRSHRHTQPHHLQQQATRVIPGVHEVGGPTFKPQHLLSTEIWFFSAGQDLCHLLDE